ncbi:MAG: efflux RND transporter permease subunit, partial [Acidobacteriota bacterium]
MKFAEYSVFRPVTVSMAVLSILVLGFISLKRLPLALLPDISSSSLNVFASYPSSSPSEVERDITRPLEEALSTLEHLERIESTSSSSGSNVRLEFKQGANMDLVALEVRDHLDQVRSRLPQDLERITIRRWQSTDSPVHRFAVGWKGDPDDLYNFIEDILRPRLERLEGVANVDVRGIEPKQIIIDLNPESLQAYGVDIFNLSQALRAGNVNVSGGYVIDGDKKYTLRTVGEFKSIDEIASFPLLGGRLKLSDLGSVRYDFPEATSFSRLNSHKAVTVVVYKASTANVVQVCKLINEELGHLRENPRFKEALSIQVFRDQSEEILKSIRDLTQAGIFGGILAAVVLYLFLLKFRSTLIISLSIPVSIVFTFAFMYLLRILGGSNISVNIVSLMGLMVAVGMLVDASVVVLENIFRHKQQMGMGAIEAAVAGTKQVGVAVLASTATTVVVFLSFLFVEDSMSGRWLRDFGVSVSAALLASLVVSLTLVPMLAGRVFTGREKPVQRVLRWLTNGYGRLMRLMLRWRFAALVLIAMIGWASYTLFSKIDRDLFPRVAQRQVRLDVLVERSFSLTAMENLFGRLESELIQRKKEFEIESVSSNFSNRTSQRGRYRGNLNIFLTDEGKTTPTQVLSEKIRDSLPLVAGVEYRFGRRRHYGGGSDMGVEVLLKGDDPGLLELYGDLIKARLFKIPGVKDVQTTLETGDDEIHVRVDRKRTEQFGISPTLVARTL